MMANVEDMIERENRTKLFEVRHALSPLLAISILFKDLESLKTEQSIFPIQRVLHLS